MVRMSHFINNNSTWVRRVVFHDYFPISLLLIINLVLGLLTASHYGEGLDEEGLFVYGGSSLSAYTQLINNQSVTSFGPSNLRYYGPSYLIVGRIVTAILQPVFPHWTTGDVWHFVSFLTYQIGLLFLFALCLRLMGKWAAFSAVLLFASQPVLWGHSFINQKDIPFMVSFLIAIVTGIAMTESFETHQTKSKNGQETPGFPDEVKFLELVRQDWGKAKVFARKLFISFALMLFTGLIIWLLGSKWLIPTLIKSSINAGPSSFFGSLFAKFAQNATNVPVDFYITKAVGVFNHYFFLLILAIALVILIVGGTIFRSALTRLWTEYRSVFVAGIFLGLCTSIRLVGPAAGIIVVVYYWLRTRVKISSVLALYLVVAALVTYITWPFLWASPISRFIESASVMASFPFQGPVLFNGVVYRAFDLPRTYLPVLLTVQFTEPVIFLFFIGIIGALIKTYKQTINRPLIWLMTAWFFVPFCLVILLRPNMYDNFRQFLFIIPPIFIFAGIAFDLWFAHIRNRLVAILVVVLILLPGVFWNIKLFPYQYAYYNSFIGGDAGAFRNYETDYWMTSYREAAEFLNQNAPPKSKIYVWSTNRIAKKYFNRNDLSIKSYDNTCTADYAIIPTRYDTDLTVYPDDPVIYQVEKDHAVFMVVKQLYSCHPVSNSLYDSFTFVEQAYAADSAGP
jgi:hypothetical protein